MFKVEDSITNHASSSDLDPLSLPDIYTDALVQDMRETLILKDKAKDI